jgi:putative ABC transport system permease protein
VIAYFLKSLLQMVRHARTLYALTVLGVSLGVASVACIQIINLNALAAFAGGVRAVSGDADLSVVGLSPTVDEDLYPRVLGTEGVAAAWPLYRVDVTLAEEPEAYLEVVGVDFFAPVRLPLIGHEVQIAPAAGEDAPADAPVSSAAAAPVGAAGHAPRSLADVQGRVLGQRGWVALTPSLAAERGWSLGDTLRVTSGSRTALLRIGALVDFQRYAPLASRWLAVMDIAQVQSLLGRRGRLSQIDVRLVRGDDPRVVADRLAARLGPTVQVLSPEQREQRAASLLAAFRLNLTALSLVSVFVGIFLVHGSIQASLVRRRREFGLLRSLGATRRQVLAIILGEAALLGALGTAAGLLLGYWAALGSVDVVSSTLTNIYLLEEIERLRVPLVVYLLATLIGIGGGLAGALLPALDMSRRDSQALLAGQVLHRRLGRLAGRLAVAGVLAGVLVVAWYFLGGRRLQWSGFLLGFGLLVALPLLTPLLVKLFCGRLPARGLGLTYSLRNLAARLHTTAFALAGLGVTVTMMVGITLLIGSFRATLRTWLDTTIRADVYVAPQSWARARQEAYLSDSVVERILSHPLVRSAERLRTLEASDGRLRFRLVGVDLDLAARGGRLPLLKGRPETVAGLVRERGEILISEPLARRAGLEVGDTLRVIGPLGTFGFRVAGISYDYTSERGSALMSLDSLSRVFGPGPVNNLALYLRDGADPEDAVASLRAEFAGSPLLIRSNATLRREILKIFDQTFAITRILQGMALIIALCGISLTLIVLARERVAELALYRALGGLRRQIFGIFVGEGLGLGLLGLLLGGLGGGGLAAVLILVINRDYFGWTIRPAWPWPELFQEAVMILVAAVLASLYPALRASRVPARELSRDDLQ